ncbi:hypothetical protein [Nocardia mexicana]|uniref:Uncharacterized protein n=1 Tax=Nocardia mexicana TaxID=279262 RepID=A0A370HC09_9NOCA|nr:hypothetical protein [Nocardia mexicana]RDI54458.1 hypothetical protein DFR68_102586 [Nocardia mexicana]
MSTRDITVTVTVDEAEWLSLNDAAECAGMGMRAYIAWGVRLLAAETRPGRTRASSELRGLQSARRKPEIDDEPESVAWAETFAERLSHRTEPFRD